MTDPDEPTPCEKCGTVHRTAFGNLKCCIGHVKYNHETGERLEKLRACTQAPMKGQRVCFSHGGATRAGRAKGEAIVAQEKAAEVLRKFGQPVDVHPAEALLETVKWTAGYVLWLRNKVADTDTDEGLAQFSKVSGKREPSVWVALLGEWQDRLVRVCAETLKAGIDERRVRLAERQGELVADVIRKIGAALNLTPEQAERFPAIVSNELRRLAA